MKRKKFEAKFPLARIKKIMQTDEEVGKIAKPTPFLVSKALELFIQDILKQSAAAAEQQHSATITPSHLRHAIMSTPAFDFLKDTVQKVPEVDLSQPAPEKPARKRRAKKEGKDGEPAEKKKRVKKTKPKDSDEDDEDAEEEEEEEEAEEEEELQRGDAPDPMVA